jgi:hypothetical protein
LKKPVEPTGYNSDQRFSRGSPNIQQCVATSTGPENRVTGTCVQALTINLKEEITFEDVPPLILTVMKMQRRAAIWRVCAFIIE